MDVSEPLSHFVDDLLGYLYETHPTHATFDGVHTHDDLLEDLSRSGIERDTHALAGYLRRLQDIKPEGLTDVERLEQRMLISHIQSRMFELEDVRTWEKNPQYYSDILGSSLAGQALFAHAPADERARRVLSKLRQTPRLIQAARDNIVDPPGIFVKVGIETMRGALKFIDDDLPKAFASVDDLHLLGDLADAQTEASQAVRRVRTVSGNRSGAASARFLPSRQRQIRTETSPRRGHRAVARATPRHRDAGAEGDAGRVQIDRRPDKRRRSTRRVGPYPRTITQSRASSLPLDASSSTSLVTFSRTAADCLSVTCGR